MVYHVFTIVNYMFVWYFFLWDLTLSLDGSDVITVTSSSASDGGDVTVIMRPNTGRFNDWIDEALTLASEGHVIQ